MTDKQAAFVREYLVDMNATKAAIRAGYAPKNASKQGFVLRHNNAATSAAIEKALAERSRRTGITAERVLEELGRLAFVNPADLLDLKTGAVLPDARPEDLAAIAGLTVRDTEDGYQADVRLCDKLKALELAGKHLGMFVEKKEISGAGGQKLDINIKVVE